MSDSLPEELLILILQQVERVSDLLEVRLASQTLNTLAAPLIFRVVVVQEQIYSADWLLCLQEGAAGTRSAVREISFKGAHNEEIASSSAAQKRDTRTSLCAAFSRLDRFSNLQALHFDFSVLRSASDEVPYRFRLLQLGSFASLAAHPPRQLSSLTLLNVVALRDDVYSTAGFLQIFRSLRTLVISVLAHNLSEEGDFFQGSLLRILQHAPGLTSLSMRFSHPVGVVRALLLSSIHLPAITHLQLDNFVLNHTRPDYDALEFIARHKATLKHLTLSDCSVYGGEHEHPNDGVYSRPWHSVFQTLQDELVHLRSFRFEMIYAPQFLYRYEYLVLAPGQAHVVGEAAGRKRIASDEVAYESLMSALESRSLADVLP